MKTEKDNPPKRFGFIPRVLAMAPEGLKFFTLLALTCWIPTIAFCLVIDQSAVSCVMAFDQVLGGLLGFLIYRKPSNRFLSCIPLYHIPDVPSEGDIQEMKKAA